MDRPKQRGFYLSLLNLNGTFRVIVPKAIDEYQKIAEVLKTNFNVKHHTEMADIGIWDMVPETWYAVEKYLAQENLLKPLDSIESFDKQIKNL